MPVMTPAPGEGQLCSVVVPTHNRKDHLRRCLTAVLDQDFVDYEVLVIDDASSDGTADMVRHEFPHVRLLRQSINRGPAAARNLGIHTARGDIVAFTDDDCLVPRGWLTQLASNLRDPEIAGVGGYQEAPDEILSANIVARAEHFARLRRWGERAHRAEIGGEEVPGLATNNVAYRKNVLESVGGFDETFPVAAGEDTDLKLRIAQAGHRLKYIPLKVDHHQEYALEAFWRAHVRRGIGAYVFESKHRQPPSLLRILLRFAKRDLQLVTDLRQIPWRVALVMWIGRMGDAVGQLTQALGRSHSSLPEEGASL